jgi:HD-GYP domain-containing protein (c-di-GMP phosphodiesterase class II)
LTPIEALDTSAFPKIQSFRDNIEIIFRLMRTLRKKERYKIEHLLDTSKLMFVFAQAQRLSPREIIQATISGYLHDVGKIRCNEALWRKPKGDLTEEDWDEIHQHPIFGEQTIRQMGLKEISQIIFCHHEYWNGRGYPQGLEGEEIPPLSRMLSIADSYSAMTHDHGYNHIKTPAEALKVICDKAGARFDPGLVQNFLEIMKRKSPDSSVRY